MAVAGRRMVRMAVAVRVAQLRQTGLAALVAQAEAGHMHLGQVLAPWAEVELVLAGCHRPVGR